MQAFGGLVETGIGAGMALYSGGLAGPLGWPIIAHGLDHYVTGMNTAFSGAPKQNVTSQLLQQTGISPQNANLVDNGISIFATIGSATYLKVVPTYINLPVSSSRENNLVNLYRAVKPVELADIQQTGVLRNLGSAEGKYFTTSMNGASFYAKQAVRGFGDPPYTLITTRVHRSIFEGLTPVTVDRGIPTWVVPNERLQGLIPEVLDYMPISK